MYEPARILLLRDYVSKILVEVERTVTPAIHDDHAAGLAKQVETDARTLIGSLDRLAGEVGRLNERSTM